MFTLINPWAVLVAAIVAYLVGWAWYSPILWAKPWLESRGKTPDDMKGNMKGMPIAYGFINTLLMSFVIAVFLTLVGTTTLVGSLQVALLLCFGFVVTVKFNDLLYTGTPPHWGKRAQLTFLIDSGYQITLFLIVSAIIWYMS
jgi:ABC-type uncharacterized transport system permease subunit